MWSFDKIEDQQTIIDMIQKDVTQYVLKPNLEAGGNNIYNEKILETLNNSTPEQRRNYVLMQKIHPFLNHTVMFMRKSINVSDVITELGIFGGIVSYEGKITNIDVGGNLIKSKIPISEDGGVVIGHAVFDSLMINENA
jgi:hypothetical protein